VDAELIFDRLVLTQVTTGDGQGLRGILWTLDSSAQQKTLCLCLRFHLASWHQAGDGSLRL